ncbi:MAG: tripartite tricarboxylate transporter permease [Treponema sp.]|nr:tripartite tricarboxylate transporter permease [Treponema sp.]
MGVLEGYLLGFANVFTLQNFPAIFIGVVLGLMFGAIPGITTSMGMALVLPVTFTMPLFPAIGLLLGIYVGGTTSGFIPAILLNIPGTPASIATTFDGHPMARRGEASTALGIALISSFIGGVVSLLVLFTLAPVVAGVALSFGPVEFFSIVALTFVLVASLSGKSLLKGLISAMLGVMLTTIGMAPLDGVLRYTFGFHALNGGLSLMPVLIGAYAVTEVLTTAEFNVPMAKTGSYKLKGFGLSLREAKSQIINWLRSAFIGVGVGILPGIGANVSNLLAHAAAKAQSKYPEKFGTGVKDGVVAPETANNAVCGSSMIPVLTLGIPADPGTAMLLVAMTIHGIQAGPLLFDRNPELIYTIFAFMIVAFFIMISAGYFGMRMFLKVLSVPKHILLPIILVICCVGAFSLNNRLFDVGSIIVIAVLAYGMSKFKYPLAPFILGFILGDLFETSLRRSLMFTRGNMMDFFQHPVFIVALITFVLVVAFTVRSQIKQRKKQS